VSEGGRIGWKGGCGDVRVGWGRDSLFDWGAESEEGAIPGMLCVDEEEGRKRTFIE